MTTVRSTHKRAGIIDLILILLEYKRFFLLSILLFSITGVITSLVLPKHYRATAVLLPPRKQSSPLSAMMGDLPISGLLKSFDVLSGSSTDQYLSILNSTRLADTVISKFDLARYYGFGKKGKKYFKEDVYRTFFRRLKVDEDKWGNIAVAVTDTNPGISAAIANFLVEELDRISYDLSRESARNSRHFLSERLSVIKSDLDSALKSFTEFKLQNNYIDLEEQVSASIGVMSKLEASKIALDLEIDQLRNKFGPESQRLRELQTERRALTTRIAHYMDSGSGLIISLRNAPEKGVRYAYLYRDVKIQEALYQYAIQMFEQAKFKEADNTPAVQVLEYARVPQKKIRPKRMIICVLFFFSGVVLSTILILVRKWYSCERDQQTEAYLKLCRLKRSLGQHA